MRRREEGNPKGDSNLGGDSPFVILARQPHPLVSPSLTLTPLDPYHYGHYTRSLYSLSHYTVSLMRPIGSGSADRRKFPHRSTDLGIGAAYSTLDAQYGTMRAQDLRFPTAKTIQKWLIWAEVRRCVPFRGRPFLGQSPNNRVLRPPTPVAHRSLNYIHPIRRLLQIITAIIVVGTSAAVISEYGTWSSCSSIAEGRAQYCTRAASNPQAYINIALFTGIIGLLFVGMLAVGVHVVDGSRRCCPVVGPRRPWTGVDGPADMSTRNRSTVFRIARIIWTKR